MKLQNRWGMASLVALLLGSTACAEEIEVAHWWTSGGESAAVGVLADAFTATGNTWQDGAIAGSSWTALPIIVSRIVGGNPMAAAQIPRGLQANELIEAGLLRDITAEAEGWKDVVRPSSLLDACTIDGKIYCVPVHIHSWQWLWLSNEAFAKAGVPVPKDWNEFVAAAPALEAAGIVPLAMGGQSWQQVLAFTSLLTAVGGPDLYNSVFAKKDVEAVRSDAMLRVFQAMDQARRLAATSRVQDWNEATAMVIAGKAAGQIMGDWAQAEFAVAGKVAGKDYGCLPGLGLANVVTSGGDAFYFPLIEDEGVAKAQDVLASTIMAPATQVAFASKKGSLPVRGDVDLASANECMLKGLEILDTGTALTSTDELISPDTNGQLMDLMTQFFAGNALTVEAAHAQFVAIIESAE